MTPPWHPQRGGLVDCPKCGVRMEIMFGADIRIAVRINPTAPTADAVRRGQLKVPPTDPRFIALFHQHCRTPVEVVILDVIEVADLRHQIAALEQQLASRTAA